MKRVGDSSSFSALLSIFSSHEEDHPKKTEDYSEDVREIAESTEQEECSEGRKPVTEKKRRLSNDQVKALERNFEEENKLELERKMKIAGELGLQPRQVAVWFQNRRARWKTKELEKDYGLLKSSYEALKLSYINLEQEKSSLESKIRNLEERLHRERREMNPGPVPADDVSKPEVEETRAWPENGLEEGGVMNTVTEDCCNFLSVDQAPSLHWFFTHH